MALIGGATHVIQWPVQRASQPARGSQSQKAGRSPDRSLQLDCLKSESLVIAGQNTVLIRGGALVRAQPDPPEARHQSQKTGRPGGLAQLGEHLLCKQGVVGSIPSSSSTPTTPKRPWVGNEGQRNLGKDKRPLRC